MSQTSWTAGDVSGSQTLVDNDHVYPGHWNELRVAVNALEAILDPDTSLLTSPVITSMQINDTSADHQYVFAVNELTADRTVTLPLLTGNDEFVFKDHTQTLTNKTLTSPTITSPTINTAISGTAVLDEDAMGSDSATKVATQQSIKAYVDAIASDTLTLTNKRITKRVTTITSHATPTVNTDNCDVVTITAQAEAITSMTTNLSGTPTNFQTLIFRILDDGTGRAITWGATFQAMGIDLPTTTTSSKVLTVGFLYDTVDSKWGCVAVAEEG